jgi:hypothetical protein
VERQNIVAEARGREKLLMSYQTGSRKHNRNGWGTRYSFPGYVHSDLLLLARPHFLKFPAPPNIAPPTEDHGFNT